MAAAKARYRAIVLVTLIALVAPLFPLASQAVTKSQVDRACADSRAQYDEYRAAQAAFETASTEYWVAVNDVERVEAKQVKVSGSIDSQSETLARIQSEIEAQAVELYMRGGFTTPGIILSASSVDEIMTTSEFLTAAATGGKQSVDDLVAARNERDRLNLDLDETRGELEVLEDQRLGAKNAQENAMISEQAAYSKLSENCRVLSAKYDSEQAAKAAAAKRRASAAGQRASGSIQVGSLRRVEPRSATRGVPRAQAVELTKASISWRPTTSRSTRSLPEQSSPGPVHSAETPSTWWPTTGSRTTTPTLPATTSPAGRASPRGRRSLSTAAPVMPAAQLLTSTSRSIPVGEARVLSIRIQPWQARAGNLGRVNAQRRRIDIVLEPEYLDDIASIDLDDLRERRVTAEDVEAQISYYRRLLHGRMDLINFELSRRSGEEERTLLEALPEILASEMVFGTEPNLRYIETMPPLPTITGRRLIDKIMDDGVLTELPDLSDDEVHEAIDRLREVENQLSAQRKRLHIVIDALQDEIVARYRTQQGEAQVSG